MGDIAALNIRNASELRRFVVRKRFCITCGAILAASVFLQSPAWAQNIQWKIKPFRLNLQMEKARITGLIRKGFTPYGLAYSGRENKLYMLFTKGIRLIPAFTHWKVNYIRRTRGAMRRGITGSMNAGWLPMGMAGVRRKLAVLYVKGDLTPVLKRWDIKMYNTWPQAHKGLTAMMRARNVPVAIDKIGGRIWIFYIQFRGRHGFRGWSMDNPLLNRQAIINSMNSEIRKGYSPVGITITPTRFIELFLKK